ncbi:MAG: aspartate-semialdehyde dehydrogenase [Bacteroidales bacterium]|nr:aspartate-semialdehyde dehydrogenase [Bacteroidales bacterium]
MKVAVVGATGLVGTRMLQVLEERHFPVTELLPVASEKSIGRKVAFAGKEWTVVSAEEAIAAKPALALFSAGGGVSGELAPKFAAVGCRVVDNSSFWRMDPTKKLVVPEINGDVLGPDDWIIANPNCSTIQMVLPLAPVHKALKIKRIVVSTYQSVTGTGYKAIAQMNTERSLAEKDRGEAGPLVASTALPHWGEYPAVYPYPIDQNILPHIDSFLENGYTKEEMKMVNETKKILRDESIAVTATTVRVPVQGGHSESINVEVEKPFELDGLRALMSSEPGVVVQDNPAANEYPMPLFAWGKDEVFVGRIRRDFTVPNGFNFWCVSDNIRKGAATNAVQIAQKLLELNLLKA